MEPTESPITSILPLFDPTWSTQEKSYPHGLMTV